jgi:hypothetical protein
LRIAARGQSRAAARWVVRLGQAGERFRSERFREVAQPSARFDHASSLFW